MKKTQLFTIEEERQTQRRDCFQNSYKELDDDSLTKRDHNKSRSLNQKSRSQRFQKVDKLLDLESNRKKLRLERKKKVARKALENNN